ncbi:MAG: DNA replication/repair protein RecF [Armatimonadota bacterium]|nr:DNA replication/repair protein RecF [Armatimonadota bacterium]MDR5702015.1 DNA replication/repair protein RecF [Armatimonadota bacterium]
MATLLEFEAQGFRNLGHVRIDPGEGLNFLIGGNAQGKTSLIEAVYMVATGRSPRARKEAEVINCFQERALLRARVRHGTREESLDVMLWRVPGFFKELRVNGKGVSRGEFLGHIPVILAWAHDQEVLQGAPALRRRLLDEALVQVSRPYYGTLVRYGRALHQRNSLLRKGFFRELEPWDEQLILHGVVLTVRRHGFLRRLAPLVSQAYQELTGGQESLEVHFLPSWDGTTPQEVGEAGRAALKRFRKLEEERGSTLTGPHRDEVVFRVGGLDLRAYGSRGQQVAAMLAWRLGEWEVFRQELGEEPVLLLDDVLAELDLNRQSGLLARVAHGPQVLVTATSLPSPALEGLTAKVFFIHAGRVSQWAGEGVRS